MQKSVIGFQCSHDFVRNIPPFGCLLGFSAFIQFFGFLSFPNKSILLFHHYNGVLISLICIMLQDPTFAREFIKRKGTDYLVKIVETENQ